MKTSEVAQFVEHLTPADYAALIVLVIGVALVVIAAVGNVRLHGTIQGRRALGLSAVGILLTIFSCYLLVVRKAQPSPEPAPGPAPSGGTWHYALVNSHDALLNVLNQVKPDPRTVYVRPAFSSTTSNFHFWYNDAQRANVHYAQARSMAPNDTQKEPPYPDFFRNSPTNVPIGWEPGSYFWYIEVEEH